VNVRGESNENVEHRLVPRRLSFYPAEVRVKASNLDALLHTILLLIWPVFMAAICQNIEIVAYTSGVYYWRYAMVDQ
jgi:hypothetical protein